VIQPDHAARNEEIGQQSFRILNAPYASARAYDYRNNNRDILLVFPITILPFYVSMDVSGVDRSAQNTGNRAATGVELMNKIG
jgi:hypothetical protein